MNEKEALRDRQTACSVVCTVECVGANHYATLKMHPKILLKTWIVNIIHVQTVHYHLKKIKTK